MLLAAAAGFVGGWLGRGQGMAALRAERDERLQQFRDALKDIDVEKRRGERIPELEARLQQTVLEREQARSEAAALKAAREEREQAYQDQLIALKEQGEALKADRCTRSAEHTSELQSLMRHSYAIFCLKKKKYATND